MIETENVLAPDKISERQRAIVECGLLIDALADKSPNIERIQATWQQTDLRVRGAIAELHQMEAASKTSDE